MRRALLFAFAVVAMSVGIAGCRNSGRVISRSDMAQIYADMFLADQWLKDNPKQRKHADTTLFYEPLFRKYGYTRLDYDRSLHYYLDNPEKYEKLLKTTASILKKREEKLVAEQDEIDRIVAANAAIFGYEVKDFSEDSLRWLDPSILWRLVEVDTTALDSLSLDSLRLDSLRLDSLRLDSLRLDSLRVDSLRRDSLKSRGSAALIKHVSGRKEAAAL